MKSGKVSSENTAWRYGGREPEHTVILYKKERCKCVGADLSCQEWIKFLSYPA
jgi:hypothetical protein